jgi:hypothetical protein
MRLLARQAVLPSAFTTHQGAVGADQFTVRLAPRLIGIMARIHHELHTAPRRKA